MSELAFVEAQRQAEADSFLSNLFPERKVRRILFVNPPEVASSLFAYNAARRGRYTSYPPYGLALLATCCRQLGLEPRILDLNHKVLASCAASRSEKDFDHGRVWRAALDQEILDFAPDLGVVTCMFTMTHKMFKQVCQHLARHNRPVAVGGVHVTNDVRRVLDDVPEINFAFLREGEVSFSTFLRVVNGQLDGTHLSQVIFNGGPERLHFSKEAVPSAPQIDLIPAYDLIDVSSYSKYGKVGSFTWALPADATVATVLSNRGCRARCTFCSVRNFNGLAVRQRSVPSIVDELELLRGKYGVTHVMWLDDDLFKDHRRAVRLFKKMSDRNINLTWDTTNGVLAISCTDEVVGAAAESGCVALRIGMESGNPHILRQIKKPATVDDLLRAAEVLRRYESINTSAFLMLGFPGETLAMILDTINLALRMNLDWYRIQTLQPLPGTPIYNSMVEQGIISDAGFRNERLKIRGAYSAERGRVGSKTEADDFFESLHTLGLDQVPLLEQLPDLWFLMNYTLNYQRIFFEQRPTKLRQLIAYLRHLTEVVSPHDAISLYFLGFLQWRVAGAMDGGLVERLFALLEENPFRSRCFQTLRLSVDDLAGRDFSRAAAGPGLPRVISDYLDYPPAWRVPLPSHQNRAAGFE